MILSIETTTTKKRHNIKKFVYNVNKMKSLGGYVAKIKIDVSSDVDFHLHLHRCYMSLASEKSEVGSLIFPSLGERKEPRN